MEGIKICEVPYDALYKDYDYDWKEMKNLETRFNLHCDSNTMIYLEKGEATLTLKEEVLYLSENNMVIVSRKLDILFEIIKPCKIYYCHS
ncbi:hypothetical protein [Clostridium amazonitimonense]|uniref:hypothetical protein n=1 Tax=Clostridium amazonitimonense TaxID=1499689 RepID=UPI0005095C90|nr:hypothetical protein [Clostridium amazonitimonense]